MTKVLVVVVSFYYLLVSGSVEYAMPYASCLWCCGVLLCCVSLSCSSAFPPVFSLKGIWSYCVCICFHDNGRGSIYCEVYVGMVICGDMQVCLSVVFCVDSLLLCVHIHHTQNILHLDNVMLCVLHPGTGNSDLPY